MYLCPVKNITRYIYNSFSPWNSEFVSILVMLIAFLGGREGFIECTTNICIKSKLENLSSKMSLIQISVLKQLYLLSNYSV